MNDLEQQAYRDGASDRDFMEEAGSGVGLVVHEYAERFGLEHQIIMLCGKGNNAGDAYVAGIHLLHLDYHVHAYQLFPLKECSALCQENAARFLQEGGLITEVGFDDEIHYPLDGIIIDGIFGTGFKGEVAEPIASRIKDANESGLPIIAVDIPSGLNGETGRVEGNVIQAAETAFLGLPKIGFFLLDGWNAAGKLRYVDFGLGEEYIEEASSEFEMLTEELLLPLLPPIKRNRNKYEAGYVVGIAGSPEMPGASILSSISALRGGAGIVRLFHPDGMQNLLASSPYEIIKTAYDVRDLDPIFEELSRAACAFIGPGMGRAAATKKFLTSLLPQIKVPCVIDADALNLLAEKDVQLPAKTILTPHVGEMLRLLHRKNHPQMNLDFLRLCQEYAETRGVTLVLKGAPTYIFQSGKPIHISPVGDPGMATAGTGDVLTGLIAALLAQKLQPHDAACLGVYIHGVAGEQAALELTSYCMVASDLLDFFPTAFAFAAHIP